ncbi:gas vesicle protein GvpJ [Natrialbaceae archaeon A-gly3]
MRTVVDEFQPSRQKADLAEVVEMLLDKGVVINADIAVSVGDTQLLGIQVRAAIASFETAAKYGLEFPEGTDMRRVAEAVDDPELAEDDRPKVPIDPTRGVNVSADPEDSSGADESEPDGGDDDSSEDGGAVAQSGGEDRGSERLGARPDPDVPTAGGELDLLDDDAGGIGESLADLRDARTDESEEGDDDEN